MSTVTVPDGLTLDDLRDAADAVRDDRQHLPTFRDRTLFLAGFHLSSIRLALNGGGSDPLRRALAVQCVLMLDDDEFASLLGDA